MSDAIVVGVRDDVLEGGRVVIDVDGVEIGLNAARLFNLDVPAVDTSSVWSAT